MTYTIENLSGAREFIDLIALRSWTAWWRDSDVTLATYSAHVEEIADSQLLPQGFVACDAETYLGHVFLIASDLPSRPELTPWVAALWVEVDARGKGLGGALMQRAEQSAHLLNHKTLYLCAEPPLRSFYEKYGWKFLELDASGLEIFGKTL